MTMDYRDLLDCWDLRLKSATRGFLHVIGHSSNLIVSEVGHSDNSLAYVIKRGHLDIIDFLLNWGVNVEITLDDGDIPLNLL